MNRILKTGHMKKSISFVHLLILVATGIPFYGMGQQKFQNEYHPGIKGASEMAILTDGYLVAGSTDTLTAGGLDGLVMKIASDGTHAWSKVYGGAMDDEISSIHKTQKGTFILAGTTKSFLGSPPDASNIFLVEIDSSGSVIRSVSLGFGANDMAYDVKETNDYGFILAGSTDFGACLVKLDSSMNIQWSHKYINPGYITSIARAVIQTSEGGYAFTGYSTMSVPATETRMFITKTDSTGAVETSIHYSFTDSLNYSQRAAFGYDIIQNSNGNLVVAGGIGGYYNTAGFFPYMPMLAETSLSGMVVRSKSFFLNSGDCRFQSVKQTSNDGYILGGYMGNYYLMMTHTDTEMTTEWCYHYDEMYNPLAIGYCALQTSDGGFILSGSLFGGSTSRIVKTDSDGISGCAEAAPLGGGGISSDLALGSITSNWTVISGANAGPAPAMTNGIYCEENVICSNVGMQDRLKTDPLKIYPNPVTTLLTIFTLESGNIYVMNLPGEILMEKRIASEPVGRIDLDVSGLPNGLYFIKVGATVQKFIKK
jgi:hypothetical protein